MIKIRQRKETGKLYLDFHIQGIRFREQTLLIDSTANRRKLTKIGSMIEAKILLSDFYYEDFFPNSQNNIFKAASIGMSRITPDSGAIVAKSPVKRAKAGQRTSPQRISTPLFSEFAEQWFQEKNIEWRKSHLRNVRSMLDSTFLPRIGNLRLADIDREVVLKLRMGVAKRPGRDGNVTVNNKTINNLMGVLYNLMQEAAVR